MVLTTHKLVCNICIYWGKRLPDDVKALLVYGCVRSYHPPLCMAVHAYNVIVTYGVDYTAATFSQDIRKLYVNGVCDHPITCITS